MFASLSAMYEEMFHDEAEYHMHNVLREYPDASYSECLERIAGIESSHEKTVVEDLFHCPILDPVWDIAEKKAASSLREAYRKASQ